MRTCCLARRQRGEAKGAQSAKWSLSTIRGSIVKYGEELLANSQSRQPLLTVGVYPSSARGARFGASVGTSYGAPNANPQRSFICDVYTARIAGMEKIMSMIDKALLANEGYARTYDKRLRGHPHPKVAVVTCMDPRLSDLEGILGLSNADLDVIRTGGPAVTDDVLGELIVSTRVLGSREIMLLNHTGCGFATFTDEELNARLCALTGDATPAPMGFFSYRDPESHTKEQITRVRSHPWIAKDIPVRGFIFDVDTGRLREVTIDGQHNVAA